MQVKKVVVATLFLIICLEAQKVHAFDFPNIKIPNVNIPNQETNILPSIVPPQDIRVPSIPSVGNIIPSTLPTVPVVNGQNITLPTSLPGSINMPTIPAVQNTIPTIAIPKISLPSMKDSMASVFSGILGGLGTTLKNAITGLLNSLLSALIGGILNPLLGLISRLAAMLGPILAGGILIASVIIVFFIGKSLLSLLLHTIRRR